jgi:hypothetical protein
MKTTNRTFEVDLGDEEDTPYDQADARALEACEKIIIRMRDRDVYLYDRGHGLEVSVYDRTSGLELEELSGCYVAYGDGR